jgi:hypothetical protein
MINTTSNIGVRLIASVPSSSLPLPKGLRIMPLEF